MSELFKKLREMWLRFRASARARELADYIEKNSDGAIYKNKSTIIIPNGMEIHISTIAEGILVMNEWYYDSSAELIHHVIRKGVLNGKIKFGPYY